MGIIDSGTVSAVTTSFVSDDSNDIEKIFRTHEKEALIQLRVFVTELVKYLLIALGIYLVWYEPDIEFFSIIVDIWEEILLCISVLFVVYFFWILVSDFGYYFVRVKGFNLIEKYCISDLLESSKRIYYRYSLVFLNRVKNFVLVGGLFAVVLIVTPLLNNFWSSIVYIFYFINLLEVVRKSSANYMRENVWADINFVGTYTSFNVDKPFHTTYYKDRLVHVFEESYGYEFETGKYIQVKVYNRDYYNRVVRLACFCSTYKLSGYRKHELDEMISLYEVRLGWLEKYILFGKLEKRRLERDLDFFKKCKDYHDENDKNEVVVVDNDK